MGTLSLPSEYFSKDTVLGVIFVLVWKYTLHPQAIILKFTAYARILLILTLLCLVHRLS